MKKIIIIFLGLSSFIQAAAQWQGTNPVYVSSGYVGIGTSSPAYKLDITNLSTEQQNLFRIRVDGAPNDYFNIANATGASGQFIPYLHGFHSSDNREALYITGEVAPANDSGTEPITWFDSRLTNASVTTRPLFGWGSNAVGKMILTASGSLGIGTMTPNFKLELAALNQVAIGKTYLDNCLDVNNSYTRSNFGSNVYWDTNAQLWQVKQIGNNDFTSITHVNGGALAFMTAASDGNVAKSLTNSQFFSYERMRINYDGKVGIGNTSPTNQLTIGSVVGTTTSTQGITLGADQNTIEFLNSNYGSGYGAKLYGLDQGNGLTSFRLAVRGNSSTWTDALFVKAGDNGGGGGNLGYIGLGTSSPDARLTVKGQVHANEVKVDLNIAGPDYVFEKDYQLTSLEEIKTYIDENKHLPEVPSAKEMEKNGVQLGEMNMILLKKIEELTLHIIEQEKRIKTLEEKTDTKK